jgi:hypothetical protein
MKYLSTIVCLMTVLSCGRDIENSKTNNDNITRLPVSVSIVTLIETFTNSQELKTSEVQFKSDAWIKIPEAVFVQNGNLYKFNSKITFNTSNQYGSNQNNDYYKFYCKYEAYRQAVASDEVTVDGFTHVFKGCFADVNNDGVDDALTYKVGNSIPQDENNYIRFEMTGHSELESNSLTLYTDIETEWR